MMSDVSEWLDAQKYIAGDYGSIANDGGDFLLHLETDQGEFLTTIACIDHVNRWCDDTGEVLSRSVGDFEPIAVTEIPEFTKVTR